MKFVTGDFPQRLDANIQGEVALTDGFHAAVREKQNLETKTLVWLKC